VVYQATPTLREIQEVQPLRRGTATRSSSEGSKRMRKPRQLHCNMYNMYLNNGTLLKPTGACELR
jgi:hypothetical protein